MTKACEPIQTLLSVEQAGAVALKGRSAKINAYRALGFVAAEGA